MLVCKMRLLYRRSQFPQLQQHHPTLRQFSSYSGRSRFAEAVGGRTLLPGCGQNLHTQSRAVTTASTAATLSFPSRIIKQAELPPSVPLVSSSLLGSIHARSVSSMSSVNLQTNYPSSRYYGGNSKHLGPGSECPPLDGDKARLYNMRFCPYAQRAILVAEAKGFPYDVVNINLKQKPEWIFPKNPMGKVPTLELASKDALYESLVVADYFDEVYPGRKLNSSDPYRRAQDRILIETFGPVITSFYKIIFSREDPAARDTHLQGIRTGLAPFEKELEKRGTKFLGGDLPGMVDYMIWPWVERLSLFKLAFPDLSDFEKDKKENPRLEQWRQAMKDDPAVKIYYLTPEQHFHFMKSYIERDTPDYDCLEE